MIETTPDMPLALKPALEYLAKGFSVLPLCPAHHVAVGKGHRGCTSPGKRPFFPDRQDGTQGDWQTVNANHIYEIAPGAAPAVLDK